MEASKHPFEEMRAKFLSEKDADRQLTFEESCIKRILRHASVSVHLGRARGDCRATYKVDSLNFLWFHHTFPQFPVRVGSAKIKGAGGTRIGWTDLFGRGFRRLPWVVEYHTMAEQYAYSILNDRVALVFNAPHADKAGAMVIHNQPGQVGGADPERTDDGETRIVRPYGNPRIIYVIESFNSFLRTVGTDWAATWQS